MSTKIEKKFIKRILLIVIISIISIIIVVCGVCTFNGVKYIEDKYDKHFSVLSIKPFYYENNADFFDLPKLYKKGNLIPFTIGFSDGNKRFTVIYKNGKYYDDYQLEDIHNYTSECFKNITGNENIQCVLFNESSDFPCYNYYCPLLELLTDNNKLWTYENIDELIALIINNYDGVITIYINDSFNDLNSLLTEKERIDEAIATKFKNDKSYSYNICFVNYSLPVKRISAKSVSSNLRFDYYGLKSKQSIINYYELNNDSIVPEGQYIISF